MHHNLQELVKQWDRISDTATKAGQQYAEIDALHWFNYLAFDIIGDLVSMGQLRFQKHSVLETWIKLTCDKQAFGAPFGMLSKGKDIAEVQKTPNSPVTYAPAIEVLNRRGEVSGTIGCLPMIKPYARYLPDSFFRDGIRAIENLAGIATARVNARLDAPPEDEKNQRKDLLARLMEGKDENGNRLGREELTAEALTQLIAGSDTTSNTSCALLFWCLKTPGVMEKLQKELDEAIPDGVIIPDYETVKDLP